MQENTSPMALRETYVPNGWIRFLWWLSTAEKELLKDCMIDRNRYAIVGMSVLGTWLFATLAWTYFFSTVVNNVWAIGFLGLFMGCLILSIDRALIKGINRSNKKRYVPLIFRGLLALVIGIFMAQPALLYLFNKEIHVQISLDNEQRKRDKKQQEDSLYQNERTLLLTQKNTLQKELTDKYAEVGLARDAFIRETDGTGGSKKIGLKDIAQAKQREYLKLDADYRVKEAQILPQIHQTDSLLAVINTAINQEQAAFANLLNDGFITRIEALNHLVKDNPSVAFRYYLLVVILLLIELMPVISKILLPEGTYEEKARLREKIEIELTQKNHERELALKELYNQTAYNQDREFITDFFKLSADERKATLQEKLTAWKSGNTNSFDSLWEEMKRDLLTKQEH